MFDIDNFNVVQDDKYYYVFRSLESGDISDINDGIMGVMRTDRERYKKASKYNENSSISLEEMFDHIKIHYRQDTNCISFTTNAGIASLYGRDYESFDEGVFNDQYVILKIPKNELGTTSFFAPLYFIEQITKVINEYYVKSDATIKQLFDSIDKCETQEELSNLLSTREEENIFEGGIEFSSFKSVDYSTLSLEQNLVKNKLVAKIGLLPFDILPNASNKFLIQTLGSSFASMEITHYQSINSSDLINCPQYILDIFSILQQSNNSRIKDIEKIIIDKLSNNELNGLEPFKYYNYELTESDLSIDNLYVASDYGKVDYSTMRNLYIKTFYLAKSKLRAFHSVKLLYQILGNEYADVLSELLNTYGIEPQIANKQSISKINISDSIGLSYSTEIEKKLFDTVLNLYNVNDYEYLLDNKQDCISMVMLDILSKENNNTSKEDYYANAIIDAFDWNKFNVKSIALRHRFNLINKLKESNFMNVYDKLKESNYSYKNISRILLANIILENKEIDYEDTFTIEDLQDYLGYFKLKNSGIVLTRYQSDALRNMKESYKTHRYTNVILPTGTGKSFVAISEMLEYLNSGKKVLYLAPDREILYQIKYYLVTEVIGDSFYSDIDKIVSERYPNLITTTYADLVIGNNRENLINQKFDFIVTDELHRTGAKEWKRQIEALFNNQDESCKILGITATPTRDCDGVDMAEYWAHFFGYTDEEIYANQHLAYNMDYNQAITFGYLANPRVINCDYEFFTESEEIKCFLSYVESLTEEEKRKKLSRLKRDIANSKGIAEILKENVIADDRCLVYCPIVDYDDATGVKLTDEEKINKYRKKIEEIYGSDNIECYSMLGSYGDKKNQDQLDRFNADTSGKIKIMLVLNKMNEGKHGKYNKIIWFRTLDDNSYVLCSQQLGRISKLVKRGVKLKDEDRPLVIDLPNNLLRIQRDSALKKSVASDDISKFRLVVDWIKEYNKIPDINSKDYIESNMAATLKIIIFTYHKLIQNIESIQDIKTKYRVKEIKRLSEELEFDIWSLKLPKRTKETRKRRIVPYYAKVNPIYRDYLKIVDLVSKKLTIEQRLEEIISIYNKTGKMPNMQSKELFSNGAMIGGWINWKKTEIIKLSEQGNTNAKLVVEQLKWNEEKIELSIEQRLEEIIAIYNKTGVMPNTQSKELFSNGSKIGFWIGDTKKQIIKLSEQGNINAQLIVKQSGWIKYSIEEKLDEIVAIYNKTGIMPNTKNKEKFSNNIVIGSWINRSKDEIIKKAEQGNSNAQLIVEKLGWNDKKNDLSTEERVNEIVAIYNKTGIMPNMQSKETFSNGALIGGWINWKKTEIIKLSEQGNPNAQLVVEQLKWNEEKIELSIEQRLEEIIAIYNKIGIMPNTQSKELFSNGFLIGSWLNRKENQNKIISLADHGNPNAQLIVEQLELKKKKIELSFEDKLEEIVKIYELTGRIPNTHSEEKFSNGNAVKTWLFRKDNQAIIKQLADHGNPNAQLIIKKLGWNYTIEQRLEEVVEMYKKTGIKPTIKCKEKFSNNTIIGLWVNKEKEQIKKLAAQGNINALLIIELLEKKNNTSKIEQLCNDYNINYKINKKYLNNLSSSIFESMLNYLIERGIEYKDSDGLLISDFYMSSKDFESKYGISIIELVSKKKSK